MYEQENPTNPLIIASHRLVIFSAAELFLFRPGARLYSLALKLFVLTVGLSRIRPFMKAGASGNLFTIKTSGMKKENTSFFARLFGAKGTKQASQEKTNVVLTAYSQPHVLKQRMLEENMTHGQTVTANISPVRLDRSYRKEAVLYFCPMRKIDVLATTADGDGGSLPPEAIIEGLSVPAEYKSGLYKLCNVQITSNGTMQVKATSETTWEKVDI